MSFFLTSFKFPYLSFTSYQHPSASLCYLVFCLFNFQVVAQKREINYIEKLAIRIWILYWIFLCCFSVMFDFDVFKYVKNKF